MRVDQIDSDLYVLVGKVYQSNTTVFINGDEALIVDGMGSRDDAEKVRRFIEEELKKQVRFIVITHYFSDHLANLKVFPGALIIAHKNYLHTFTTEKFRSKVEETFFVEPDIQISDGAMIKWGRFNLDIFYNPCHTMSTLNIDVPELDLIIIGDTVVGDIVYLYYSIPEMFIQALQRIKRRSRSRLLTSHQGVRTGKSVDNALYYLSALKENAVRAERSDSYEQSIHSIKLEDCLAPGVEGSDFDRVFHKRNLESIIERRFFVERS
jgi:cyclase